jgi:hypothetical protein
MSQARELDELELAKVHIDKLDAKKNEQEVRDRNRRVWETQVRIRKDTEKVEKLF